jgi:hypothetical protein
MHRRISRTLLDVCLPLLDLARPKDDILQFKGFERFGFADCSILAALDQDTELLTSEVPLYLQALHLGASAI